MQRNKIHSCSNEATGIWMSSSTSWSKWCSSSFVCKTSGYHISSFASSLEAYFYDRLPHSIFHTVQKTSQHQTSSIVKERSSRDCFLIQDISCLFVLNKQNPWITFRRWQVVTQISAQRLWRFKANAARCEVSSCSSASIWGPPRNMEVFNQPKVLFERLRCE